MARRHFGSQVQQGETFTYTVTFTDEDGAAIDLTDATLVSTATLTFFTKDDPTAINSWDEQDILGTPSMDVYPGDNNHTISAEGVVVWNATADDTDFSQTDDTRVIGRYVIEYDTDRVLIHEFEFTILAVTALS